ncbi:hypothetical protein EVJ58_g3901 [Rhodofomes roseus]|uniref:Major facilitator superfamily (MFS) profile domain-containing protein n=1 Tax=Rhodofomes roseus TaxID=34475 RepID=A0A4Y9YL07_9APHY|nr:hypothetical protein EVJ58_g3901 [Rhodofomes roseus]
MFRQELNTRSLNPYHADVEHAALKLASALATNVDARSFEQTIDRNLGSLFMKVSCGHVVEGDDDTVLRPIKHLAEFAANILGGSYVIIDRLPFLCYLPSWAPGTTLLRLADYWRGRLWQIADSTADLVRTDLAQTSGSQSTSCMGNLYGNPRSGLDLDAAQFKFIAVTMSAGGMLPLISSSLGFLHAMARFPEAQKRAQAELDRRPRRRAPPHACGPPRAAVHLRAHPRAVSVGRPSHRSVRPLACHACWRVLIESGSVVARRTLEDDELAGYRIPKGATIVANNWAISRDPGRYEDPQVFRPERFLPLFDSENNDGADAAKRKQDILDPRSYTFGYGRRICPGLDFAEVILFANIAHILTVFDVVPTGDPPRLTSDGDVELTTVGAAARDDDQTLHSDVPTVVTDEHPQLYNSTSAAAHQVNLEDDQPQPIRKGTTFWMILSALIISFFMVVLEGASVGNASPTIAGDLSIIQFAWIGTAYGLSSTALLPLSGGLAQVFGRRPVMLVSLTIFAVGGALSGASRGTSTLFAGRTIQGLGGGGVLTLSSIILSDLVALHERGLYNGLFSLAWTAASGVGPVIGGSFAQSGHWRWLFYMNVPFAGCAAAFVFFFVRLPTPPGSLRSKLKQIDWILVQTGLLSVPLTGLMYYLPVYYQACTLASPIRAGTLVFGVAFTVAPTTLVAGALITATKRYRPPIWFGWVLLLIGQGLLTTLKATSAKATSIGFQILIGVGIGAVYSSTYFPVLAPLPVEQNAPALALYVFLRSFAQIWGVAIGATVLQNQLSSRLPQAFLETLPSGASVAYSAIPRDPCARVAAEGGGAGRVLRRAWTCCGACFVRSLRLARLRACG